MDESLAGVFREVQVLRLQYERLIEICEVLLKPCQPSSSCGNRDASDTDSSFLSLPATSSPPKVCSDIDKLLEKARKLTISNPAVPSKPRPKGTSMTSLKQATTVYKPVVDGGTKKITTQRGQQPHTKTCVGCGRVKPLLKQATPTEMKKKVDQFVTAANDVELSSQLKISSFSLPPKYRKLKAALNHLIDVLQHTESHDTGSRDTESHDWELLAHRISPLDNEGEDKERIKLCLLVSELHLANTALNALTCAELLVTDRSPIGETEQIKAKFDWLLHRVCRGELDELLPLRPHRSETLLSVEDHVEAQLIILDLCTNKLLPWLRQADPNDKMYPVMIQTIQVLTKLSRTTFVSTVNY